MERRLRSSSEGAGGPRIHGNHRDAPGMEGCGLLKHRNNSSSSKLGSLVGLKLMLSWLLTCCFGVSVLYFTCFRSVVVISFIESVMFWVNSWTTTSNMKEIHVQ